MCPIPQVASKRVHPTVQGYLVYMYRKPYLKKTGRRKRNDLAPFGLLFEEYRTPESPSDFLKEENVGPTEFSGFLKNTGFCVSRYFLASYRLPPRRRDLAHFRAQNSANIFHQNLVPERCHYLHLHPTQLTLYKKIKISNRD